MALEHLYLEVSDIQAGPGAREKRCFCFFVETFLLSVLPCFVCVCVRSVPCGKPVTMLHVCLAFGRRIEVFTFFRQVRCPRKGPSC